MAIYAASWIATGLKALAMTELFPLLSRRRLPGLYAKQVRSLWGRCQADVAYVNPDGNEERPFLHIHSVNAFHRFMKERDDVYRGAATKYLNCHDALFSRTFRGDTHLVDEIHEAPCSSKTHSFHSSAPTVACNQFSDYHLSSLGEKGKGRGAQAGKRRTPAVP